MKFAITDHAVQRYVERAEGARDLSTGAVRMLIQERLDEAFQRGEVRDHPSEAGRKIVPFRSGASSLYFSLGPNKTQFAGDMAVIGVLYDRELGGITKGSMGVTLGDIAPELMKVVPAPLQTDPKYIVRIGTESYDVKDDGDLKDLLQRRQPRADQVVIYQKKPLKIRTEYVIEE